jgi:ADP-heptose:LPS heptosyltransferase
MNARTKVRVDRIVGGPLAWGLNFAARALGRTLRRNHSVASEDVHTIVIAKYVGMGSILEATPLIRTLKAGFPRARIIFVTGASCRPLVERFEHVDAIVTIDDRSILRVMGSSLAAMVTLIRARVDLYFDLELYSTYGSIMALLSLTRNRIGFYRESAEHKVGIYTHLMYFNTRCPIRYIYLQLARAVRCAPVEPDSLGKLRVDEADRQEMATVLASCGIGQQPYLVINPNASDLMVERRWPAERFAALIGQLTARLDLPVLLIGSPPERAYVASVVELVRGGESARVRNLAGALSLGGLLALLERARCLITNDTGPMHMAWALSTPVVCLFGPVDPAHYGWSGANVEIVYHRVYCSPCLHEADEPPCRGDNICMQRIEVDPVFAAVQRILAGPVPTRLSTFEPGFFVDEAGLPLGRVVRGSIEKVVP